MKRKDAVVEMTMARSLLTKFSHEKKPSEKAKKAAKALHAEIEKAVEGLAKKREVLTDALK